jgi:hypothetical protein
VLAKTVGHQSGRPEKPSHDERGRAPKLKELGITYPQSSCSQSIASIPEEEFERHIEETKRTKQELTITGGIWHRWI